MAAPSYEISNHFLSDLKIIVDLAGQVTLIKVNWNYKGF